MNSSIPRYDCETVEPVKYDDAQLTNSEIFLNAVILVFGIAAIAGIVALARMAL